MATVTLKIKEKVKSSTGFTWEQIAAMSNQDIAAQGVAESLDFKLEPCTIHQSDKIAASCLGDLTRSRNKVIINPFPVGQMIMQKSCDQSKFLSSSLKNRMEYLDFQTSNPDVPEKLLVIDNNKTRMFSAYELAKSNLYIKVQMSKFLIDKNVLPFFHLRIGSSFMK